MDLAYALTKHTKVDSFQDISFFALRSGMVDSFEIYDCLICILKKQTIILSRFYGFLRNYDKDEYEIWV